MYRRAICNLLMGVVVAAVIVPACSKNKTILPDYIIPVDYSYGNADSLKAKIILSMLAQIDTTIAKGNTAGVVVSAAQLKAMYANTGNYFTDTTFDSVAIDLDTSGVDLQSNTVTGAQALIASIMDSIGVASSTGQTAANGVAGVSGQGTLLSANGVYWRQFLSSLEMGVILGHQIQDVCLGDSLNSPQTIFGRINYWDRAFFLWGVPSNFPVNRAGVSYWGVYTSAIDSGIARPVTALTGINANTTLLNAFVKGRAALTSNDLATAQAQAAIIIPFFETMEAAAALHAVNKARVDIANGVQSAAADLSASLGFWTALQYNTHKNISDTDYQTVLNLYGTNFYNMTQSGLDAIVDKISSIYGWDAIKSNL